MKTSRIFLTFLLIIFILSGCNKDEEKIFINGYYSGSIAIKNGYLNELISFNDEFYVEFPSLGIKNQQLPCFSHGYYKINGNTISFNRAEKTNCSGPDRLLSGDYNLIQLGDSLVFEKGSGDEYVKYMLKLETSVH